MSIAGDIILRRPAGPWIAVAFFLHLRIETYIRWAREPACRPADRRDLAVIVPLGHTLHHIPVADGPLLVGPGLDGDEHPAPLALRKLRLGLELSDVEEQPMDEDILDGDAGHMGEGMFGIVDAEGKTPGRLACAHGLLVLRSSEGGTCRRDQGDSDAGKACDSGAGEEGG